MSRKIATIASSCGNICTSSSVTRPNRRPVNRMRENAYAASAHSSTVATLRHEADDERVHVPRRRTDCRIVEQPRVARGRERGEQPVRRERADRIERGREDVDEREEREDDGRPRRRCAASPSRRTSLEGLRVLGGATHGVAVPCRPSRRSSRRASSSTAGVAGSSLISSAPRGPWSAGSDDGHDGHDQTKMRIENARRGRVAPAAAPERDLVDHRDQDVGRTDVDACVSAKRGPPLVSM